MGLYKINRVCYNTYTKCNKFYRKGGNDCLEQVPIVIHYGKLISKITNIVIVL